MTTQSVSQRYGPWALVTGASSGIGREIAIQLANKKLNIILVGRDITALDITAAMVRQAGTHAKVVCADFENSAAVSSVIAAATEHEVGLLVPAAGFGEGGSFLHSNLSVQHAMQQVNITAVMALTHHFANQMVARQRGGIIFISSMLAFHGAPFSANYAATKAYIQSFGEALAVELKPSGIDVLVSAPGPTSTGFANRANMKMGKTMTASEVASATLAALGQKSSVLPGSLTKFLRGALMTLPRALQIRIIGNIMKGFAQKH